MPYYEYIGNLHIHTPYSDGKATHAEITDAALAAHLDFVIVTDHNIWVNGVQGYYGNEEHGYVLLLTGQEIHDRTRQPQANHCLVIGASEEMSQYAHDPQTLIDTVRQSGGLTFLAHPFDEQIRWRPDSDAIPWLDWDVSGYTGLEVWNYMSCFKGRLPTPYKSIRRVFEPEKHAVGPRQATLDKWDELLSQGNRIVGIGGSDAHGTRFRLGPIQHTVFPYDFLFQCVNMHVLLPVPLSGNVEQDAVLIYDALRGGRAFIGYHIVGDPMGFRFTAQGAQGTSALMGESIRIGSGVTLQVIAPNRAYIKLIRQGAVVAEDKGVENLTYVALEPGAYRAEVWQEHIGLDRCWIISNPIYVEPKLGSLFS